MKLRVCFTKRFLSVTRAHFLSPSLSPYEYDGSAVFSRLFYIVNIFEKLASGAGPVCLSDQLQRAGPGRGGSGLRMSEGWGLKILAKGNRREIGQESVASFKNNVLNVINYRVFFSFLFDANKLFAD